MRDISTQVVSRQEPLDRLWAWNIAAGQCFFRYRNALFPLMFCVAVLTLQFIRPLRRQQLIRSVANGLHDNGCLLLVEKVLSRHSALNRFFITYYYGLKQRNGYSQIEIAQKREALENVLIPYRIEENTELLLGNGFRECEVFFKWYNFSGIIGIK